MIRSNVLVLLLSTTATVFSVDLAYSDETGDAPIRSLSLGDQQQYRDEFILKKYNEDSFSEIDRRFPSPSITNPFIVPVKTSPVPQVDIPSARVGMIPENLKELKTQQIQDIIANGPPEQIYRRFPVVGPATPVVIPVKSRPIIKNEAPSIGTYIPAVDLKNHQIKLIGDYTANGLPDFSRKFKSTPIDSATIGGKNFEYTSNNSSTYPIETVTIGGKKFGDVSSGYEPATIDVKMIDPKRSFMASVHDSVATTGTNLYDGVTEVGNEIDERIQSTFVEEFAESGVRTFLGALLAMPPKTVAPATKQWIRSNFDQISTGFIRQLKNEIPKSAESFSKGVVFSAAIDFVVDLVVDEYVKENGYGVKTAVIAGANEILLKSIGNAVLSKGSLQGFAISQSVLLAETAFELKGASNNAIKDAYAADAAKLRLELTEAYAIAVKEIAAGGRIIDIMTDYDNRIQEIKNLSSRKLTYLSYLYDPILSSREGGVVYARNEFKKFKEEIINTYEFDSRGPLLEFSSEQNTISNYSQNFEIVLIELNAAQKQSLVNKSYTPKNTDDSEADEDSGESAKYIRKNGTKILLPIDDGIYILKDGEYILVPASQGSVSFVPGETYYDFLDGKAVGVFKQPSSESIGDVSQPATPLPVAMTPITTTSPLPSPVVSTGPTPEELAEDRRRRDEDMRLKREAEINNVVVPALDELSKQKANLDIDIKNAENELATLKFHDLELVINRLREINPEIEALRDRAKGALQLSDLARDQLKIRDEINELGQIIQIRRNLSSLSLTDVQKARLDNLATKYGISASGGQRAWQRLLLNADSLIKTRLDRAASNQVRIEKIGDAGPLSSAERKRLQDLMREQEQLESRQDEIADDIRDTENDLSNYQAELDSVEQGIHSKLKRLGQLDPNFIYTAPGFTPAGITNYKNYITTDRIGVPQAPSIPSQDDGRAQSPSENEDIDLDIPLADTSDRSDEDTVDLGDSSEPDDPVNPDPMLPTAPTTPVQFSPGDTIFSVAAGISSSEDFIRSSDRSFGDTAGTLETLRFGLEPSVDTLFSTSNDRTAEDFSDLAWGSLPGFANAEFGGVVAPMQNTHWLYGNATDRSVLENRSGSAEFSGNVYGHFYDRTTGSVDFDSVTGDIDLEVDFSYNSVTGFGELGIDRGAQNETRNLTVVGSLSDDNVSVFRRVTGSSPSFDFDIGSTANVVAEVSTDNGGSGGLVGGIFGENGSEFGGALSIFSEDDYITGVVTAASNQSPEPDPEPNRRRGDRVASTAESPWDDLRGYVFSTEADGRGGGGIQSTSVQRYFLPGGSKSADKSIGFQVGGTVWTTGDQDEVYDFLEFGLSDVLNNLPDYEQAWWVYGSRSPAEQVETRTGSADFYGTLHGDVTYTDFDDDAERKLFYDSTGGEIFLAINFSNDSVSGSGEVFTDYRPDDAGISVRESFTISGDMNSRPGLELEFTTTNTGPSQIQGDRDWIGTGSATTTFFSEDATELGGSFWYETEALGGTSFNGVIVAYDVDVSVEASDATGSPGDTTGGSAGDGTTGDSSGGVTGGTSGGTAAFVSTQNASNNVQSIRGSIDRIPVQGDIVATVTIPPLDGGGTLTTTQVLAAAEYNHTSWGRWGANANTPSAFSAGGHFVAGILTPASVVENRTGTASYSGGITGDFVSGVGSRSSASGTIDLEADFANQNISGEMQFSHGGTNSPVASLGSGITNGSFSQTSTDHGFNGAFFGPNAEEVGGAAWMNANGGTYNGVFRAQNAASSGSSSAGGTAGTGNGGNSF